MITVQEAQRLGYLSPKKRGKFNNQRTNYNGRWYDSKKEAHRAYELDMLARGGYVKQWSAQPEYKFIINGVKIGSYFADFLVEYPDGHTEVEDVKGVRTDLYKWKCKMMEAIYKIKIKEL